MGLLNEFLSIRRTYRTLRESMRVNAGSLRAIPIMNQQHTELLVRVKAYHKNHFHNAELLPVEREDWLELLVELDLMSESSVVSGEVVSN